MTLPIFHDDTDYPVGIGTIVAFTEGWCDTHKSEMPEIYDFIGQVVAFDDESGELGVLEITDTSGEWMDWRPNYAKPVQWEWNYRKYAAI